MRKVYKNLLINGRITDLVVENGLIASIGKVDEDGIDIGGCEVIPGLVDVHIHGAVGKDTMDGNTLNEISKYLASRGVTSFMPTTMTVGMDDIKAVVNGPIPKTDGAQILGYHLEGPYIAESRRGAQNIEFIRRPDIDEFNTLENIKMVTVAPEVEGGIEFIKKCKAVVSLGHTDADYDCSLEAIRNGANCLTHTFNAMTPFSHRFPGPVGAAITGDAYVQVICDGVHIHEAVVNMLYRTFGKERMVIISDCMKATGMPDGLYEFGGQTVKVEKALATLLNGVVAGSTSDLMTGLKKAIEFGIPKDDAIYMATAAPANLIGVNKGRLKVGYDADFVVMDAEFNVLKTVIGGEIYNG